MEKYKTGPIEDMVKQTAILTLASILIAVIALSLGYITPEDIFWFNESK